MMKKLTFVITFILTTILAAQAKAAEYKIDVEGAHAFIQFKIKHLGYSWLLGRFNTFDGSFKYDAKSPEKSSINVVIDTASIDSNHAERDKHLRGDDFLDTSKHPKATFKSTKYEVKDSENGIIHGDFSFHGVTKSISFPVKKIGEGKDPWGGYRVGFEGKTSLVLEDYGIKNILGPDSANVLIELYIEGIRKK
jgi:polyisoprenoid-binding protein YceI